MKFEMTYRASLYAMLFLATLVVTVESSATVGLPPIAYAGLVAASGALALITVDREGGRGVPRWVASYVFGIGSMYLAYLEYVSDPDQLIYALAHFLIYLIIIKMFLPEKVARDDWTFFLLGLVLVLIGGWVSPSDSLGLFLLSWALASLWALGLFHLAREAARRKAAQAASRPQPPEEPYPGLIDRAFLLSALRVAGTTLALGGLIFLVMPRWGRASGRGQAVSNAHHLTGFSDRVALGQIGEMLENDSVVMSVEIYDAEGARAQSRDEPLWRGVTLDTYEDKRWSRSVADSARKLDDPDEMAVAGTRLRQVIKLESNLGDVLFALRPILSARSVGGGGEIEMGLLDGTLFRPEVRDPQAGFLTRLPAATRAFEYEVLSVGNGSRIQPMEHEPPRWKMLAVPDEIRARLKAISDPIVMALPEADRTPETIARALEQELQSSGRYAYSLRMIRTDPTIDPILDFLENHRQGHCEYFASALTLLLRVQGVPARLINGFKNGDWNALGGVYTVRQKHAHTWVEALISPAHREPPDWVTLDPTPALDRDASVARVGGGVTQFRTFNDYLRYIWTFYIVGYSQDRQQRLVYGPSKALYEEALRGFRVMGQAVADLLSWMVRFPDLRALFSVKGFFVSTLAMIALALIGRGLLALAIRARGWLRKGGPDDGSTSSGVAFYARLLRLLGEVGLERTGSETPREFARRAAVFLAARSAEADGIAEVPPLIVDAFYRVRFGQIPTSTDDEKALEARLDELADRLAPTA